MFEATRAETETLALAAALGAVQAGAGIRLRHLAAAPSPELVHKGYGTLQPADLAWADSLFVAVEAAEANDDLKGLAVLLEPCNQNQTLGGKRCVIFRAEDGESAAAASVVYLQQRFALTGVALIEEEPHSSVSSMSEAAATEHMTGIGRRLGE